MILAVVLFAAFFYGNLIDILQETNDGSVIVQSIILITIISIVILTFIVRNLVSSFFWKPMDEKGKIL